MQGRAHHAPLQQAHLLLPCILLANGAFAEGVLDSAAKVKQQCLSWMVSATMIKTQTKVRRPSCQITVSPHFRSRNCACIFRRAPILWSETCSRWCSPAISTNCQPDKAPPCNPSGRDSVSSRRQSKAAAP